MNVSSLSTGWPDALSKLAIFGTALCALITMLVTRCDQQQLRVSIASNTVEIASNKVEIATNKVETISNANFLNAQFDSNYVAEVKNQTQQEK